MNKIEYLKAHAIYQTLQYSLANVKFETVTLADTDEVINISGREVGAEVFVGEGEAVADGTYKLSDGFEFEVLDSKISKVLSEVAPLEEEAPVELADETQVESVSKEDYNAILNRVTAIEDMLKKVSDEAVLKDDEFTKKMNSINAAFSALAKIPAETSKVNHTPKAVAKQLKDNASMRNLFEATQIK